MDHRLADVALPVPVAQLFTYSIPEHLTSVIVRGSVVTVPFGRSTLTGVVISFPAVRPDIPVKPIHDVTELEPLIGPADLRLAAWIADYYQAPLGETVRLFLPPGYGHAAQRIMRLNASYDTAAVLSAVQKKIVARLTQGPATIQQIGRSTGIKNLYTAVKDLAARNIITIEERAARQTTHKKAWFLSKVGGSDGSGLRGATQRKLWEALQTLNDGEHDAAAFMKEHGASLATLRALEGRGLITLRQKVVDRTATFIPDEDTARGLAIRMNEEQEMCVRTISRSIDTGASRTFLLHGITGSGKTQVYIESIRQTLERGKTAIVLIPEISLTPQTVRRFQTHFQGRVVWMHSRMSDGERHDAWRAVHVGRYPIVIGPRSALFAPLKEIGLIIVDEEHESSYKQFDATPRYHARDAAIMRASLHNAVVVLGSATPSVESYSNALQERYTLLTLNERADNAVLPPVTVVDMTEERRRVFADAKLKAKELGKKAFEGLSRSISSLLEQKIRERLERKEGVILLQNRRGFAPFIECRSCGHVEQCDQCSVTMTYHATKKHLRCHYCGSVKAPPTACRQCGGFDFAMNGFGTQRVEEELNTLFPSAVVARMDMDSTTRKGSHERILREFGNGGTDILLGTQMVAKGLDFPRVTLVGVISADTQMMLPDFRSAERTFQLLTQVAGRAGRGTLAGEVIIQTSQPAHYALKFVREHDFTGFFAEEAEYRRSLLYPPFSRIIVLEFKGRSEQSVEQLAAEAGRKLLKLLPRDSVLGPSPAVLAKIKNDHRWQIIIKAPKEQDQNGTRARHAAARVVTELHSPAVAAGCRIIIDVDPASIL
ncbi:MAG: primosomal protein N' [Bacteroidetes bacterium]|nr:primosomal protein N' [Bacteroidota bacterium]